MYLVYNKVFLLISGEATQGKTWKEKDVAFHEGEIFSSFVLVKTPVHNFHYSSCQRALGELILGKDRCKIQQMADGSEKLYSRETLNKAVADDL